MTLLSLRGVHFAHPGFAPVVQGLDLDVEAGEVLCLLGRSGCGKTTVLKLAAGLLAPSAGTVSRPGRASAEPGEVGFVFQDPTLLDWLDARGNVLLPVTLRRRPTPDDRAAAHALLAQLGLAALADRHPAQLSGGQRSRVALARALLPQPPLLLLDEPFAALDALTREDLQRDLLRLARARGIAVVFVTHDIHEAVFIGDRVAVMARGRLVHTVTVDAEASLRDTPAFAATCARLREALAGTEVTA